jgi:hypothetical protein
MAARAVRAAPGTALPAARVLVLMLGLGLPSCLNSDRPHDPAGGLAGSGGTGDQGGEGGRAGSPAGSGGDAGSAGQGSSAGSGGGGGSGSGGGSGAGGAGSGGGGGSGGSGGVAPDAGGGKPADAMTSAWPGCLEPVFSGVMPSDFCMVYAKVCTFTGTNHYTSMADCMTKFHGGSSDGDACKSGHLCRAATMPAMKDSDCATAGTARCSN